MTSATTDNRVLGLNEFFAASEARVDRWRTLNRVARALVGTGPRPADASGRDPKALLAELAPLEDLCGYPGPRLMAQVHERAQSGDWTGLARLVQRISNALLTNSYRDDQEPWKADEEGEARMPDVLPPSIGRGQSRRPYFEVLSCRRPTGPCGRKSGRRSAGCGAPRTSSCTSRSSSAASRTRSWPWCSTPICRRS